MRIVEILINSLPCDVVVLLGPVPPMFTQPLNDIEASEKGETQFEVRVIGVPEPEVAWYKDDHPVHLGERIRAECKGNLFFLKIKDVDIEDEGLYTAKATNSAGMATCDAELLVECK